MTPLPYSVLDLAPLPEGVSSVEALRRSLELARRAEEWGYGRYWVAEHHNIPGIASVGDRGADRRTRRRHLDDPRRLGRRHAAQPRAARDRRAVRHARGAASRAASTSASAARRAPTRSPRAPCAATLTARRRRLPGLESCAAYLAGRRRASASGRCPGAGATCRLAAGLERLQRAARRPRWACPSRSRPTSRPALAAALDHLPGALPAVRAARRGRTRWSASPWSPPTPTGGRPPSPAAALVARLRHGRPRPCRAGGRAAIVFTGGAGRVRPRLRSQRVLGAPTVRSGLEEHCWSARAPTSSWSAR